MRVAVRWASDELESALAKLSSQQARGVVRIVQAELEGRPLSALLDHPDQICTSTTYYGSGKRKGWRGKPEFQRALAFAQRDYRKWLLEYSTGEALSILASTAPKAVRALNQQVEGDLSAIAALQRMLAAPDPAVRQRAAERLGDTELSLVAPALSLALVQESVPEVRDALIDALGRIAGSTDSGRRAAATAVLDRAGTETASKQSVMLSEDDIEAQIDRELARVAGVAVALGAGVDVGAG